MGLTKQYLRYLPGDVFNIIGSGKSNVVFLEIKGIKGKFCAAGACENVFIWDIKKGEKVLTLTGDKNTEVSRISTSPDKKHIAVGYYDGNIRIFSISTGECTVTFSGHKSAVTAMTYDRTGVQLASGSKDTDVIVWDIVNEAGLYRLKGHKGQITQVKFMNNRNVCVTSSKDTFVKFWDLETQHCFKTLVGHKTEVWELALSHDDKKLITGSGDNELRVYDIVYKGEDHSEDEHKSQKRKLDENEEGSDSDDDETDHVITSCTKKGSLKRQGKDRTVSLHLDSSGKYVICHGTDSLFEVFRISDSGELKRHQQKKLKKAKKKAREAGGDENVVTVEQSLEDEIPRLGPIKASGKLKSFDAYVEFSGEMKIVALLSNNTIETLNVGFTKQKPEISSQSKLQLPGHRSDVRALAFSSDNTAFVSGSGESIRVWNRATLNCIRAMACDYALSCVFAPGDRHVIVGTKTGKLQIFDIAGGILLETIDAHSGAVWSVCMAPDKRGLVSGSADKDIKFWDLELVSDEAFSTTTKRLSLVHKKTMKMPDDVLCVKYTPDQRLIAVALLDTTVKVFFSDTLKFFLSLYGHKLPVLCMDISADSTILVTGSADKNVKLWGLDFGDCHKSIFAHDDSVMCVQFVAKTHLFFSAGKDGKLKEWDADRFEHVTTLEGHQNEIWAMAIGSNGNCVVTASHDKSLRTWEKTLEPLVLDEEREMEREKEFEKNVGDEAVVPGETNAEVSMAGKKTIETVKAAERIMEVIELYKEEQAKLDQYEREKKMSKNAKPPEKHPILMAYGFDTPDQYVLDVLKKVKSSELEESLLVLPFSYVLDILKLLNHFLECGWEPELSCRCLLFLLRIHHGQITSNEVLLPILDKLRYSSVERVDLLRDRIGFNMAGLHFLKRKIEEKESVGFFADATSNFREKKRAKKRKAILTLHT